MNLDADLLAIIACPACHGDAGASTRPPTELVCTGVRPRLPGARRHPGAARRRGTAARRDRQPMADDVFDDSLLDDEEALRAADAELRPLAEAGARVRREAVEAAEAVAAALRGGRRRHDRARWSPPDPTPGCCAPCSSRGARCRSWPGRARHCRAGPAPSTWSSCSHPRAATPAPPRRWPRRSGAAARWSSPARRARSSPSMPPAGDSTVLPGGDSGDQLATAVVMLQYLCRLGLGPEAEPEAVAQALDDVAVACSPFRRPGRQPGQDARHRARRRHPLVWGGSVLAARAARRIAESLRRSSGRAALAADAEHLLPVPARRQAPDVFADPFADDDRRSSRPRC